MKKKRTLSNIGLVLGYYVKYVPGFFFGQIFFTIFVSAIWTIQGPITTKYIFDALVDGKPVEEILIFLSVVTFLVFLRHIYACYIVEYLETVANITIQEKVLEELYQKASAMDLEYYETPQFYTDYVWAASQATSQFKNIFGTVSTLVARASELIFMGGVMVVLDPMLFLFAIAITAIRFIAQKKMIKIRYQYKVKAKPIERERDYSRRVFYLSDYAKELRLSKIHEVLHDRFLSSSDRLKKVAEEGGRKLFPFELMSNIGTGIPGTLGMYLYLAYQVLEKKVMTVGDFSALSQSAFRFANRLRQVIRIVQDFTEQSLYVEKFRKFMDYEPSIEHQKGKLPPPALEPITLKNVSFTYHGEQAPSLKNINMTLGPNEKIAIVGYNGAGKTTLIKLLMRLYDVTEGEIKLGDTNIKEYDVKAFRDEFAAVFQDYQIFAATLGENVVMDDMGEQEEEKARNSLILSGFLEKLKQLPLELATPLTKEFVKEGVNLSGGEAQKVAISRAFYKDSHYAIMDEPSSALDPIAEYELNQNMIEIAKTKTVIFISHRLSTTIMADRIYMLEKGEIIEQGTHRELMELGGKYAEMFLKQAEKYQE